MDSSFNETGIYIHTEVNCDNNCLTELINEKIWLNEKIFFETTSTQVFFLISSHLNAVLMVLRKVVFPNSHCGKLSSNHSMLCYSLMSRLIAPYINKENNKFCISIYLTIIFKVRRILLFLFRRFIFARIILLGGNFFFCFFVPL